MGRGNGAVGGSEARTLGDDDLTEPDRSDLGVLRDAFSLEVQIHWLQRVMEFVALLDPAERLLLLRAYCSGCGYLRFKCRCGQA